MIALDITKGSTSKTNLKQSIGLSLYGHSLDNRMNHTGYDADTIGHVFFTRPQLNLSDENLAMVRELAVLIDRNPFGIPRWVRCTLDPRLADPVTGPLIGGVNSPLVNNKNAFIPLLSNTVISVSGWPTRAVRSYTSQPGRYNEVYMQIDGRSRKEGPVNITCEFARLPGNPVTALFETWGVYPEYVNEGYMDPYLDLILSFEIDYNIRIFRFIMDVTGKYIKRAISTLPGFTLMTGDGGDFDFDRRKGTAFNSGTVTVPFKFPAVEQNDPIIMMDFNNIAETFNQELKSKSGLKKVHINYRGYFKAYLYPYVDLDTSELITYTSEKLFNGIGAKLKSDGVIKDIEELTNG